jgi:hypothetical protein
VLAATSVAVPQDEAKVTYARRLTRADAPLDFRQPAAVLRQRILSVEGWPGSTFDHRTALIKVGAATVEDVAVSVAPGTIIAADRLGVRIACGQGVLVVTYLQRPGGKMLPAGEVLAGYPLAVGEVRGFRLVAVREGGGTPLSSTNLVVHLPESLSSRSIPPVGGSVRIDTATLPDLRGVKTALGGGPALLRGGVPTQLQAGEVRHPRTAIGWNQDDFFLLQVDGRQPSVSVGMSFAEMARTFQELGCTDALNLDGGGSSTLWVQGQVANNPSEGGERPMANSLVVVLGSRGDPN